MIYNIKQMSDYSTADRFDAIRALNSYKQDDSVESLLAQFRDIQQAADKVTDGEVSRLLTKWNVVAADSTKTVSDLPERHFKSPVLVGTYKEAVKQIFTDSISLICDENSFTVDARLAQGLQFLYAIIQNEN